MKSKIIAYGERPITQFVLSLCSKEDLDELIGNIKFKNHDRNKSELKNIFIEAPLPKNVGKPDIFFQFKDFNLLCEVKPGSFKELEKDRKYLKQIEKYHNYIKEHKYSGKSKLVKRITELMKNNKTILICITDDDDFPEKLNAIFETVGWLSYNIFTKIAEKYNYNIIKDKENNKHIWIESETNL